MNNDTFCKPLKQIVWFFLLRKINIYTVFLNAIESTRFPLFMYLFMYLYRFFTKIMSIKKDSITMITITITKFTSLLNGDFGH